MLAHCYFLCAATANPTQSNDAFLLYLDQFPLPTAARTAKTGLKFGLAFGLIQDAAGLLRGRRPGYVRFLLGLPERWGKSATDEERKRDG